jgi:hypothetical protein
MKKDWRDGKRPASINTGITPTVERCRQNGGVRAEAINEGGVRTIRYRAVWQCPLDAYRYLNLIDRAEYKAGLKFHRAYYGAVVCTPHDFRPTGQRAAERKPTKSDLLLRKVYEVLPMEDLGVVIDICGHSNPARNQRTLEILKRGLGNLAAHWKMAANEVCKRK